MQRIFILVTLVLIASSAHTPRAPPMAKVVPWKLHPSRVGEGGRLVASMWGVGRGRGGGSGDADETEDEEGSGEAAPQPDWLVEAKNRCPTLSTTIPPPLLPPPSSSFPSPPRRL